LQPLRTALITFFPAVAGSACMQMIWAEDDGRSLRAFAMLILILVAILALIIGLVLAIPHSWALTICALAATAALWVWWIANAKHTDLLDPDASVGGDPSAPLTGDLAGFKH
jgi:hypothetical protein